MKTINKKSIGLVLFLAPLSLYAEPLTPDVSAALMSQIQSLQNEVRNLRGMLEEQAYLIEQMKEAQHATVDAAADVGGQIVPGVSVPPVDEQVGLSVESNRVDTKGEQVYQAAYTALQTKQYKKANADMLAFIEHYPASPLVPNAYYWLGEIEYLEGNLLAAKANFKKVLTIAPNHAKVPDSLVKMGLVLLDQGEPLKAKEIFTQVTQRYPGTAAAGLAQSKL